MLSPMLKLGPDAARVARGEAGTGDDLLERARARTETPLSLASNAARAALDMPCLETAGAAGSSAFDRCCSSLSQGFL